MKIFRITQKFCSLLQNVPKELVNLTHQDFLKVKTAYIEKSKDDYIISLEFPKNPEEIENANNMTNNVELIIDPELTVAEFIENCREYLKDNVTLYSLETTPLAGVNLMEQIIKEPFYLLTGKKQLFFVNSVQGYDQDEYSYIKEYFTKRQVPLLEKNILTQYLVRMDSLLQQNFSTSFLKNNSISKSEINANSLIQVILDAYAPMRNTQSDHEVEMYEQYAKLKSIREQLENKRKTIMAVAQKLAKLQMFGGFMILIGHFCFMGAGIYVYYNWDVMEPIGYFLNTGGMIFLSYQYFKIGDEWTHSRFSNYLINRNFERLSKANDFNQKQLEDVEKKIQEIQDRIKTNIIINL